MKSNMKTDIGAKIVLCIMGFLFGIAFVYAQNTNQPTQKEQSEWVETSSVELPQGLEIFSGVTRNGNPKYWFVIEDIKVFISPTNKEHYINNTCTILLVEWYNKSKNTYKYTTRQKKETKQSKRINLEKI